MSIFYAFFRTALSLGILLNFTHTILAQESRESIEAVTKWLKINSLAIQNIEPGRGFADLQPLKKIFREVRIIGLGEATHGTREFFLFKHRLLEFLVKEMDVRVLAIETGYSSTSDINDYVMGKSVDAAQALARQGFWPLDTSEMRAMLDWIRAYNVRVPAYKKVKFVGFDIHYNDVGKQKILAYLRRAAPERVTATETLFSIDIEKSLETAFFTKSQKEREAILGKLIEMRVKYYELLGFLTLNEVQLINQTSVAEFNQIRDYARVLAQLADASSQPLEVADGPLRDYYMAENIKRIVDAEPQGTRVVVWAHNQHVSAGRESEKYPYMGFHLRHFFSDAYYSIGFSFNQGSFQARNFDPKANRELKQFSVGPAPEGSVDWYLARVGRKNYFIDLRHSTKNQNVVQWLTTSRPMRFIGLYYNAQAEKNYFIPTKLMREFDGIIFFDQTTPSHQLLESVEHGE
ncbi:MAG TPA: erythromycin esterase family protein [Pyrinomonadaceae bacterium]|nr:erythromycin esterase family protein [Pyrinomonadaceae bacterium]